jgi:putative tryptophan/tyrosine transport system substrate-binding protein
MAAAGRALAISRRHALQGAGAVGLTLLAGCGRWPGQPEAAPRMSRVGFLAASAVRSHQEALRWGMEDLGYIEGHNVVVESHYAEGRPEALPRLAAELARRDFDVIVVPAEPTARALLVAGWTKPIVLAVGNDPVGNGLATSLAQPGGTVTGLSLIGSALDGKRLELLKETAPDTTRIALLVGMPGRSTRTFQEAAQHLGVPLDVLAINEPADIGHAVEAARESGADAVFVTSGPFADTHRARIIDSVNRARMPAMYSAREYVAEGGLMTYAASYDEAYRRAAVYVDKILKGAPPGSLPIEQPMRFEFVINLRTAEALGLSIPQHVLLQATEVIQ